MSTDAASAGPPRFAATDEEAKARFEVTRGKDPFPEIQPALLNTADFADYVAATGMIFPFEIPDDEEEMLKPASCGIRLGGDVVYWDTDDKGKPAKVKRTLKPGEQLTLARNSIVYVTLEPMLRLPDYIAARFNLTIRDIYRGLLVGTGPLVDPGFTGRLSLPLHNLTMNDYTIEGGEPLVWMEFTKISPNQRWCSSMTVSEGREGRYVEFPSRKNKRRDVEAYLHHAHPGPITSSIPPLLGKAEASATAARDALRKLQTRFAGFSAAGALALLIALVALFIQMVSLVNDSNTSREDLIRHVDLLTREVNELQSADATAHKVGSEKAPASGG